MKRVYLLFVCKVTAHVKVVGDLLSQFFFVKRFHMSSFYERNINLLINAMPDAIL